MDSDVNDITVQLDICDKTEEIEPSVTLDNVIDDGQLSDDQSDYSDDRDVNEENLHVDEEYRVIVKLYRELPRDMFVAQLLKYYSTSDQDLERIRTEYVVHLKQ